MNQFNGVGDLITGVAASTNETGETVAKFNIAITRPKTPNEEAFDDVIQIRAKQRLAAQCREYLRKGTRRRSEAIRLQPSSDMSMEKLSESSISVFKTAKSSSRSASMMVSFTSMITTLDGAGIAGELKAFRALSLTKSKQSASRSRKLPERMMENEYACFCDH